MNISEKCFLKNQVKSNVKLKNGLNQMGLITKIYMRYSNFSKKDGNDYIHLFRGTHCKAYIKENGFDSYGCPRPNNFSKFYNKKFGKCDFF